MIVTANRTCVLLASEDMITQRIVYGFPTVPEYTIVAVVWILLHKKHTYVYFPPVSIIPADSQWWWFICRYSKYYTNTQ